MRAILGVVGALLLGIAPAVAQQGDAFVLPRGQARLRVAGEYAHFDSRFRGGAAEPLAASLSGPLTGARFAPLEPLEGALTRFFAATAGQAGAQPVQVGPSTLTAGELDVALRANARVVPMSIAVGILPRLEVGVSLPLLREETILQRLALSGGTVGLNSQRESNAALLGRIGAQWRELGGSVLLPTATSALGQELQRRVRSATGQELRLPSAAADTALLNRLLRDEFGAGPLGAGVGDWRVGDAELSARAQLLNTIGPRTFPADSAPVHYRAALGVGVRLPTGVAPDTLALLSVLPDVGRSGVTVGVDADLFLGRFWTTASGRLATFGAVETLRRTAPAEAPLGPPALPARVRWTPPAELELRVAPRYRLTDAIAVGAEYALLRRGGASMDLTGATAGARLDVAAATTQAIGLGVRYSAMVGPDPWSGGLPLEVALSYRRTLAGGELEPAATAMVLQGTLYRRLWGRR